jgi:hypothetical protein
MGSHSGFLTNVANDTGLVECDLTQGKLPIYLGSYPALRSLGTKEGLARTEKETKSWLQHSLLFKTQAYITKWHQQSCVLPFKGSFINTKPCCFLAVFDMGKLRAPPGKMNCAWLPPFSRSPQPASPHSSTHPVSCYFL